MCDAMCALLDGHTLFAKSSDRPPDEAQVVESRRRRRRGGRLRTQYLTLDDAGGAALVGSRPTWTWGLEHGVNEHGVAIGNQQIWTVDDPRSAPAALTGLDLVRLGLERARRADEAVEVLTELIEVHGQGGVADRDEQKAYFSSFLIADGRESWALETSGRSWAARQVDRRERGVAMSNRISISEGWTRASEEVRADGDFDHWRRASSPTDHADKRLAVTAPCAASVDGSASPAAMAGVLRDHDGAPWGRPDDGMDEPAVTELPPAVVDRHGTGVSVCMHLSGVQATTASMIVSLPSDGGAIRAWCLLGSPCVGVFVPVFPFEAGGVVAELAFAANWERFRALRERVEAARGTDPGSTATLAAVRAVWAPLERELWEEADVHATADPATRAAWTATIWPRIEERLVSLEV
jgi:secernin